LITQRSLLGRRSTDQGLKLLALLGEVAGDQRIAQQVARLPVAHEPPEAVVELAVGDSPAQLGNARRSGGCPARVYRRLTGLGYELPELVAAEVEEWILDRRLIVLLTDNVEMPAERTSQVVISIFFPCRAPVQLALERTTAKNASQ